MNPLFPVFVTGAVALLGLIITKESKVSEFRQAWIDSLRSEVAALLSSVQMSLMIITDSDGKAVKDNDELPSEAKITLANSLRDANTALFAIRLRLNETEDDSKNVLDTLDKIEILSNDNIALAAALSSGQAAGLEKQLLVQAKIVLSSEWKRVKKGEPYFKWTRRVAALLAILLIILTIASTINPVSKPLISLDDDASAANTSALPNLSGD